MVTPDVAGLSRAAESLREWQVDRAPMQLHPGDLGFHWRDGAERTAADLRVWSRGERVVAIGLLDAPQLLRMAVAPDLQSDDEIIERVLTDIEAPERGVLDAGTAVVEARCGPLLAQGLLERGWEYDEPWTPLHLDLTDPVPRCGPRVETTGPDGAALWTEIHWSAFRGTTMTDADRRTAVERWQNMAASPPYADARCLTAFGEDGEAVAVAGVWSSGRGRPGLLEPIGVRPEHRGRGHGRAITLAAAAALREMGASSATVCTPSANVGAVAAYASAGFERSPDARDLRRAE
ncbi:GNAT family N-acetyltransferase [Nocardioides sp. T2.26MG-1]|uniref:GNAT family N-acetyltransferase n=1 Tax=Nocardioides sp. T2.26MG-1 TaxID=3041166 RepID=UPI002477AECC|nr:GNAT family N-acetyltransferase [Nocardioides sp. T2.26MG-1]CAI9407068.1 Mycothiol acetyltransferase [Nocardioides sp. T2.26MG-1]